MSKKTIILILVVLDVVLLGVVAALLIAGRHSDVVRIEAEDEKNDCDVEDGIEQMDPHELRRLMYEDYSMPKKCPKCNGDVLPIVYGLLDYTFFRDSLAFDLNGRRRVIPAGCVVEEEKWMCEECRSRYVADTFSRKMRIFEPWNICQKNDTTKLRPSLSTSSARSTPR